MNQTILFCDNEYLGTHTGIQKTLKETVERSIQKGFYNIQIFLGSSYTAKRRIVESKDINKTNKILKHYKLNVFTHLPYIYNLAGSVKHNCYCWDENKEVDGFVSTCLKSIEQELKTIDRLECESSGCVLHIGSVGKNDSNKGLEKVAESINKINFKEIKKTKLILETMVGRGGVLGKSFQELRKVYDLINEKDRIGFCIDTCHVFAEGLYDLRQIKEIDRMFEDFDKIIGLDKLVLIHFNDSETEFCSKQDRHARIGFGEIFRDIKVAQYFMKKLEELKINSVLETEEDDYINVQMAYGIK
jgi:deoxyribonuclease-4